MKRILFLTTAESDRLTLLSIEGNLPDELAVTTRNILALDSPADFLRNRLSQFDAVLVRVVGGAEYFRDGLSVVSQKVESGTFRFVAVSADDQPSGTLSRLSTVPRADVRYFNEALKQGGPTNFRRLFRYLGEPDRPRPEVHEPPVQKASREGPADVAILYYRARALSGDDTHVDALRERIREENLSVKSIFLAGITRDDVVDRVIDEHLTDGSGDPTVNCVVTLLGFSRSRPRALSDSFEKLNVPWFQLLPTSRSSEEWRGDSQGLGPSELSMKVILPELDGRLTGPPISFRTESSDDRGFEVPPRENTPYERGIRRSCGLIRNWMNLRRKPNDKKSLAVILGNHPTSRARVGNGVGLDTPRSLLRVLEALSEAGYRTATLPENSEDLMGRLVEVGSFGHREKRPPENPAGSVSFRTYREWLKDLPDESRRELLETWDDPSQSPWSKNGFPIPGLRMGNLFVGIQPPRGFEANTEAVYHDPDLPPPHLYVAFYRWITRQFEADAVLHLGKHGTLEWLPGRSVALGRDDWPALLLEECPLVYPFIMNDPGEGTQAKRRNTAVIVDHLVAPRRKTDLPPKLQSLKEALREEDPETVQAELEQLEIGRFADQPNPSDDDPVRSARTLVDDVESSRTRSGLHVLGTLPEDDKRVDLLGSLWPEWERTPDRSTLERYLDRTEKPDNSDAVRLLENLDAVDGEIDSILKALDGEYVPAGPSGAPTDGRPDLLPSGRNFYSRDARTMPTPEAWRTGRTLAEKLIDRHRKRSHSTPTKVGVVLWGTSNMRTGGEDVAQVLALMGVKPSWTGSGRVEGVNLMSESDLGRPRIDTLVRISGFFRDAFPDLVELLNKGIKHAVKAPAEQFPNFLRRHESDGDSIDPRIFGSMPENYGAGLLPLIESGEWTNPEDLSEAFLEWGHYAYDEDLDATPHRECLERHLSEVEAVTQNRDNREHDLFDSDDYFQFQGGMIGAASQLGEEPPSAYFTDTSRDDVTVRSLAEEADRVFYSRVAHPVWQEGMRDHGYKGGFEMAATLDYVFGYDATTEMMPDQYYERMARDFLLDETNRNFLEEHNKWAIQDIGERLLEATDRGLWSDPSPETIREVKRSLRKTEATREETVHA